MYKQSTNQDPYKAIYGTKGSDVLGLQQQLNKLGAGLKEDSLYGPMTQSAYEKYKSQLTPTPPSNTTATVNNQTIGSMFQLPTLSTPTTQETDYLAMQDKLSKGEDIVDTSAIRSKTLADFQDRINAINQVYAGKLAEAKQQGVGRVGQTTAILANRGLAGSLRGGAINEQTLTQNREIEDAINQEKALALSAIYNDVNSTAQAEAQRRREAMQSGAKNYIEFIKGQDTRKQTNISSVATALLAQGIDPSTLTPEEMTNITGKINATSGDIISEYKKLKLSQDIATKKETPSITEQYGTGSIGEYNFAKAQGYTGSFTDYQNEDANRKKSIARAGVSNGSGLTPYQTFQATQSVSKDNQKRTENAREIARQSSLIASSYKNIANGGDRSLNTQAIITSFNKILDPTSVVRESEYDRTAEGQALLSQLQGKYDNIVRGGAGVTLATLKEASDIANKYLSNAQKSIEQENSRAVAMAKQFGLNPDFVTNTYQGETQIEDVNDPDPLGIFN